MGFKKFTIQLKSGRHALLFALAGIFQVSMLSAQNVGIGTVSPASRLEVIGLTSDFSTSALHLMNSNMNSLLYVSNAGYVGIGTNNPNSILEVNGDFRLTGSATGFVGFVAPAFSGSSVYTLPAYDGSNGMVLTTDGSGNLMWDYASGGVGPQGPAGPAGAPGTVIGCNTSSNTDYTIRGNGSGTWECTNDLRVSSSGYVSINTTPSSSYRLRVYGNVGIGLSPSSSFDLSVNGDGHVSGSLSVGTTTSAPSSGIYAYGEIKSNSKFTLGSSSTGTGTAVVRTSSGYLMPQSSTIRVKDQVKDLKIDKENFLKIRPVSFRLKPLFGGDPDIGLIAEEVEKLVPDLVVYGPKRTWIGNTGEVLKNEKGEEVLSATEVEPYSVRYDKVGVYLVKIVADQEQALLRQGKEIESLKMLLLQQQSALHQLSERYPEVLGGFSKVQALPSEKRD